jgi:hypothetical protein
MTDHERWAAEVGAYLLDALSEEERGAFEEHLASCAQCRRDVEELALAAAALPLSVPPVTAPAALGRRIMGVVHSEAELVAAAESRGAPAAATPAPSRPRRRWTLRPATALVTACLLLAVGVAGGLVAAGARDQSRTVVAQVAQPGAEARLEIDEDGGRLVARGLRPPPAGRVYQVWKQRGNAAPEPTDALWAPRADGSATVEVPGPLEGVDRVLVSSERMGGSDAPTTDPVVVATLD